MYLFKHTPDWRHYKIKEKPPKLDNTIENTVFQTMFKYIIHCFLRSIVILVKYGLLRWCYIKGWHWFLLIWISNLMLEIKIPLFVLHAMHMRIVKIKSEFDLFTICTYKETKNGWNKFFIFPDTSTILFEFCFWTICICNSISYAFESSL